MCNLFSLPLSLSLVGKMLHWMYICIILWDFYVVISTKKWHMPTNLWNWNLPIKKKLKLPKFCPSNAINYRIPGNICVALFSQISRILLSHEIKFRECIAIPHLLYCPRESFAKIIFTKLLKSPFLQKFSDVKISQYTVYSIVIIIIY